MIGKTGFTEIAEEPLVYTQESLDRLKRKGPPILIGIPKETAEQEKRVVLTPEAVTLLVNNGQRVVVEANAGKLSKFSNKDYSDAGARVVYTVRRPLMRK